MSPKQKKLAAKAPPPNKLDGKDFAVLRAEKAKGRGMGLQDEKVKPGKVMKAKRGMFSKSPISGVKLPKKGSRLIFSGYSKPFEGPQHKGRVAAIVGVKPRAKIIGQRKKFKSMDEMRKAKGFKPGETAAQFNKRKAAAEFAKKAASATGAKGKIALGVAAAGVGAVQYLKSKMKKKDEPKKKMGGGMMKRYNKGGGADTGAAGEARSRKGVRISKLKRAIANLKGRTPNRPVEKFVNRVKADVRDSSKTKMMGGGMMQKPMGYDRGGMYLSDEKIKKVFPEKDAKRRANISQLVGGDRVSPMKKERFTAGQSARRRGLLKKISKQAAKATPLGLGIKVGEVAKKIKEKIKSRAEGGPAATGGRAPQSKQGRRSPTRQQAARKNKKAMIVLFGGNKKYDTGRGGIERDADNNPYRYSYDADPMLKGKNVIMVGSKRIGGSVKAKCKLGRNKPTKMY